MLARQSPAATVGNGAISSSATAPPLTSKSCSSSLPVLYDLDCPAPVKPPCVVVTVTRTPSYGSHAASRSVAVAICPIASASTATGAGTVPVPVFTTDNVPPLGASTSVSVLPLVSVESANSSCWPPVIVTMSPTFKVATCASGALYTSTPE